MNRIWKYQLEITDDQYIDMPQGAKPLSVGVQRGVPCLWADVDPDKVLRPMYIKIIGTGNPISKDGTLFIGTFQLGLFVGHVYAGEQS